MPLLKVGWERRKGVWEQRVEECDPVKSEGILCLWPSSVPFFQPKEETKVMWGHSCSLR